MSNNAIFVNPLVANADITQAGSSFLFAICAVMIVTGLGVLYWTHQLPGQCHAHPTAALCSAADMLRPPISALRTMTTCPPVMQLASVLFTGSE